MNSRAKGNRAELEVRDLFRAHGFDVDRVPNSGGLRIKGDLYGNAPLHVEVKRAEKLRLWESIAQAEADAEGKPAALFFRRNRSRWYACVPATYLLGLLDAS